MARTSGPVLTSTERVPGRPTGARLLPVGLLPLGYVVLALGAVVRSPTVFLAGTALLLLTELLVARLAPLVPWALARVHLGSPTRWTLAVLALAVLAARVPRTDDRLALGTALATGVVVLAAGALAGLADAVAHLRKVPVLSRGLPLAGVSVPPEPRWLTGLRGDLLWPAVAVLLVVPALAIDGLVPVGAAGWALVLSATLAAGAAAAAAVVAARTREARARDRVPAAVQQAVTDLSPDLLLYHGGGADALYQVEMWLPTFEALTGHRTLVVLRDREAMRLLRPTSLPVVCIPPSTTLVSFDLGSVRGALFVSNAATNIHLIRKGGLRTAFIGHGDSDKASSRSPFVKVYDEIWVAGPAGAERYAGWETAGVSGQIRQVGRPGTGSAAPRPEGSVRTVLYAPTWEGWGDEAHHTSLASLGPALIGQLLQTPGIRVLYRPHPLTGTRDATVRRAHREVLASLRAAGAPAASVRRFHPAPQATGDDLTRMLASAQPAPRLANLVELEEEYWAAHPSAPRIVDGGWPSLGSCFAQTDLLIADVSGVVTDWLALDRPLVLANPAGLGPDEFARRFPSARAATLLGPDLEGLDRVLAELLAGHDGTAAARAVVREHLLGSPPEGGSARFAAAVDELVRRAEVEAGGAAANAGDRAQARR